MWREVITLWQSVRDPEYAHLLLEPLPLYGLGLGLILLTVATLVGETKSRLLALVLMGLSCASVGPYLSFRLSATPRILATRPVAAGPEIERQTKLRQDFAWVYYVMSGACLMALGMAGRRHGRHALLAIFLGGTALFWLSLWLHKKECEVYHPNVRRLVSPG
jgi:hypothetical protein